MQYIFVILNNLFQIAKFCTMDLNISIYLNIDHFATT